MISLKTVFNYIKFANELTNKVSFMFNGIKKYVVRIVCVIMLLLVQFDVCAPLIDANLAMVETMEQPTLPSDNYKPQNKMFHFCKTFCSKITLVNTIQNVILNPI